MMRGKKKPVRKMRGGGMVKAKSVCVVVVWLKSQCVCVVAVG